MIAQTFFLLKVGENENGKEKKGRVGNEVRKAVISIFGLFVIIVVVFLLLGRSSLKLCTSVKSAFFLFLHFFFS